MEIPADYFTAAAPKLPVRPNESWTLYQARLLHMLKNPRARIDQASRQRVADYSLTGSRAPRAR
jgi:hypothetical protein